MDFKLFLMENVPLDKTRLAVFDVDDTLIFSPRPEDWTHSSGQDMPKYTQVTGKPWEIKDAQTALQHGYDAKFRRKGWWSRPETMQEPILQLTPELLNQKVASVFHQFKKDPQTWVVVMTGRPAFFRNRVKEILNHLGIYADAYFFQGEKDLRADPAYPKQQDTLKYKTFVINNKLMTPNIETIEIFDDREDHIPQFVSFGENLKKNWPNLRAVLVHDVKSGKNFNV